MYTFTSTLLVIFSCALAVFATGGLEINTPSAVSTVCYFLPSSFRVAWRLIVFLQCTDVDITWSGSNAPFDLVVLDAADPCGPTL